MKLSEEDFELMLNAAWSAFENTLFVWGFDDQTFKKFEDNMEKYCGYNSIYLSLENAVELEDE